MDKVWIDRLENLKLRKKELEERSIHRLWGEGNPFYSLYDIGDYTFYPYKVVWKYVAGKISGKAEFSTAVLQPITDKFVGMKAVIPNEKLMLIPLENEQEAYYVSGILNSSIVQLLVASYVIETAISTHIAKMVKVPKFDQNNSLHQKISELSKEAHELARRYYERGDLHAYDRLKMIEKQVDETVSKVYGITEDQLREVRRCLAVLKGEEVEGEHTEKLRERGLERLM